MKKRSSGSVFSCIIGIKKGALGPDSGVLPLRASHRERVVLFLIFVIKLEDVVAGVQDACLEHEAMCTLFVIDILAAPKQFIVAIEKLDLGHTGIFDVVGDDEVLTLDRMACDVDHQAIFIVASCIGERAGWASQGEECQHETQQQNPKAMTALR
jgi:hypothetical protein